jgi:glutamine amidotransferase
MRTDNWVTVPTNSTLTIHKQTVMVHPIIDEFHVTNPSHNRSSKFARTKGQTITNAKKEILTPGTCTPNPIGNSANGQISPSVDILKRRLRMLNTAS